MTPALPVARAQPRTFMPRSDEPVAFGFAPFLGAWVCVSRAGRARAEHTWDGDGVCIFCGEREK